MAGEAFVEIGDESETLRPGQIVLISLNATAQSLQYGGQ
jgi:mannose-6-phosphate isomerase-like protein (cupin superfamily)